MTRTQTIVAASGVIVTIGLSVWLVLADQRKTPDQLGEVESWSKNFPFRHDRRAEVLATGLRDVRGVAYGGKTVFLIEADGRVLDSDKLGVEEQPLDERENMDQRGGAVDGNTLFIAQHGRGRISKRIQIDSPDSDVDLVNITGPAGVAVTDKMLYVTDDRPWPETGDASAFDSSDYSRWVDKGTQRLFGTVLACPKKPRDPNHPKSDDNCCSPLPGVRLRHPSGIAAGDDNHLFVTEADTNEVRWVIIENKDGRWMETGALASVSTAGKTLPAFLGIATDKNHYVFAAGPNSLYVFSWPPSEQMLGRVVFEEPVSGVAVHGQSVFLVVGHRLCRLTIGSA